MRAYVVQRQPSAHRARAAPARRGSTPAPAALPGLRRGACPCGGGCPRCAGGAALAGPLRQRMESRLGASLAEVRVHSDAAAAHAAAAAGAHAFTLGDHLFFGAGRFAPETSEGATRLAHELVHTLQQRRGREGGATTAPRAAEREARRLGTAAAAGQRVRVAGAAAPDAMQRDGPGSDDTSGASADPAPDRQSEDWMLRHYVRWWVGSWLLAGEPPTALPAPTVAAAAVPGFVVPPLLPALQPLTLRPDMFAPLPPDPTFLEPDVGALFSPFAERGAPVGAGDDAAVRDIYRGNARIAAGLPELRAMAPRFVRPLIPLTWRRDIAGALTGAAVGASLKHDFQTPIEVADRAWEGMTGASTTVIPLPSISFNLF